METIVFFGTRFYARLHTRQLHLYIILKTLIQHINHRPLLHPTRLPPHTLRMARDSAHAVFRHVFGGGGADEAGLDGGVEFAEVVGDVFVDADGRFFEAGDAEGLAQGLLLRLNLYALPMLGSNQTRRLPRDSRRLRLPTQKHCVQLIYHFVSFLQLFQIYVFVSALAFFQL